MTRIVYVGGRYVPYNSAAIHVEDRGFQFADAVYEVIEVMGGCLVDEAGHVDRLTRSLRELAIERPCSTPVLAHVMRETIRRNRVNDGLVYLQVTRGAAARDFLVPEAGLRPTLVCIARRTDPMKIAALAEAGIAVITMPDIRWRRSDIKTVMLLPAILAKEAARKNGAREAWLVDAEGYITEGASSNAWIVEASGRIVTRPADERILSGVTRATLKDAIKQAGLELVERAFRTEEVTSAREAFNTSATGTVMPVVGIDGKSIGDGRPGPITRLLRAGFHRVAQISSN